MNPVTRKFFVSNQTFTRDHAGKLVQETLNLQPVPGDGSPGSNPALHGHLSLSLDGGEASGISEGLFEVTITPVA